MWNPTGTEAQRQTVRDALTRCDFPFELLAPSLAKEGKAAIDVDWSDLARFATDPDRPNMHIHHHEVRGRTLGLFYLPPNTRIVLDLSLTGDLAHEVFLAEAAHAVDYHYMTNAMRLVFWNAIHDDAGDLPDGSTVAEAGDLGHGHSWFDGPMGYNTWVGESWMAGFIKAFAPKVPVTIELAHPIPPGAAAVVRAAMLPPPPAPPVVVPPPAPADPVDAALAAALRRYLAARFTRRYMRDPARAWLDRFDTGL